MSTAWLKILPDKLKFQISWQISSMANKEIKATGITPATWDRWNEVKKLLGGGTNAAAMATIVNLVHLLYFSSRWEDVQRKAATLITAQWANRNQEIVPMHPSEVKRVSMDANKTLVYTLGQGEPYVLSNEAWERG